MPNLGAVTAREEHGARVSVGRVYDPPERAGRVTLLVDRLWPRGVRKEGAPFDRWVKDVAPTPALRAFYGHRPERFEEFAERYRREIDEDATGAVADLVALAEGSPVLLLTATRDVEHSSATVLAERLRRRLAGRR